MGPTSSPPSGAGSTSPSRPPGPAPASWISPRSVLAMPTGSTRPRPARPPSSTWPKPATPARSGWAGIGSVTASTCRSPGPSGACSPASSAWASTAARSRRAPTAATGSPRRKAVEQPRRSAGRAGELAGGLAALLAILLLAVGVPLGLANVVGWPLPHALPSPAELARAFTGGAIPDEFIVNALAVIGWTYWAQFMGCLWAELAAARKGHPTRHLPLAGLNQTIAARLVGAVLLLSPAPGWARPVPAATDPRPAVVAAAATPATPPAGDAAIRPRPPTPPTPEPARQPQYEVQAKQPGRPYDTLWGIAERFLGDPRRWPEIFELNKGRPLPDPPGGRFVDPDWIYPGQILRLPSDATGLPTTDQRRQGDTDRDRAQEEQDPSGWPGGQPQRAGAQPEHGSPTAGPTTTGPSTTAPSATTAAITEPGPPTTRTPAESAPAPRPTATDDRIAVPAAVLAVGGLLAFGVLATLARLRRRQQRYRQPGRRIRLPTGAAAHIEQRLRAAAEPETADFLDAALRAMAAGLQRAGLPPPTVQAVQLGPATLEVLLREPSHTAPPPFTATAHGRRWTLPRQLPLGELEAAAGDAVTPLPALVTIGTSDAGQLLVNLEAAGLAALAGPPAATRPLLDAMAVELATAASTGLMQILLVGLGPELDRLERVQQAQRLEDALPGLERQAREVADLISQRGCGSVLGGRIAGVAADSWAPTVVLAADPPTPG